MNNFKNVAVTVAILSACALPAFKGVASDLIFENNAVDTAAVNTIEVTPAQPGFTVLPDKVSSLRGQLSEQHPVHYYGFVAVRGQAILLATPGKRNPEKQPWKVEYYKDSRWQLLTSEKMVFSNVQAGTEMIARVSSNQVGRVPSEPYQLVLGSFPILSTYDLLDEPGVVRIQGSRTEPQWLATQAYKQARLDVKFTDSKGTPLEGAEVFFKLKFENSNIPEITRVLRSDKEGVASQMIELGKCEGG